MILLSALGDFRAKRFVLFFVLSFTFASLYMVLCDDPIDFGGISVLHDSIRQNLGLGIAASTIDHDTVTLAADQSRRVNSGIDINTLKETFDAHPSFEQDRQAPDAHQVRANIVRAVQSRAQTEKTYVKYSWTRGLNMLYFSLSNTITMGYGDIYPISSTAKLLVLVQIICTFAVLCVV